MIDVVRKSCAAGAQTTFRLKQAATAFIVKNFTDSSIDVCAGTFSDSESVRIGAGMYQVLRINADPVDAVTAATNTVLVKASKAGTVEVQRVD